MSENTFTPHSRQEDEREVVRAQNDFSSGVYKDIPASEIPDDGIADLKNMRCLGPYLEGRPGSKVWGDYSTFTESATLPVFTEQLSSTSTVVGNTRTIEVYSQPIEDVEVGDYYIYGDGTHERIINVISDTVIQTRTETADNKSSSYNASIRHKVNGIFFHSYSRRVILVMGTEIYISNDYTMTEWTECAFIGNQQLSNSLSTFSELNQYLLIFNANGIYRLNTTDFPFSVYKINSAIPTSALTTTSTDGDYVKRYSYTLTRILNTGVNGNRLTPGALLVQESGNVAKNASGEDFVTEYSYVEFPPYIDLSSPISNFDVPRNSDGVPEQHWTHYSIYATLDIGNNGFDIIRKTANNSDVYIWVDDVPIVKPIETNVDIDGETEEVFTNNERNQLVCIFNGSRYIHTTIRDTNGVLYTPEFLIPTAPCCIGGTQPFKVTQVDGNLNIETPDINQTVAFDYTTDSVVLSSHGFNDGERIYFTNVDDGFPTGITSNTPYYIVESDGNSFRLSTKYSTFANVSFDDNGTGTTKIHFAWIMAGDENKTIHLSDGTKRTIKTVTNNDADVYESSSEYDIVTPLVACLDSVPRGFTDTLSDEELKTRDGDPYYLMSLRFFTPLPASDIGELEAGFIFSAIRDEQYMYYSAVPDGFEYQSGYYHAGYQFARFKGLIRALKALPDRLVVYLANSTYTVPLNVFETVDLSVVGLVIPVISGQTLADAQIGLLDYGSLADLEIGKHIMITNEPAIRVFDGNQYSENVASQRFMKDLRALQTATSAIYDSRIGYNFWGLTE
jgi:hypothetical protein